MSVLTTVRDAHHVPRPERSSVTVSDFSIDALISADLAHLRRRTTPGAQPPLIASESTSHDGVCCGTTEVDTPPPTPPGPPQWTTSAGWSGQINLAQWRRLLPTYQLDSFTGKQVLFVLLSSFITLLMIGLPPNQMAY